MKKGLVITLIAVFAVLLVFGIFHRSIISSFYERGGDREGNINGERGEPPKFENKTLWHDNISNTGTGSCTEREECEQMLGKGAFCGFGGKCFPAPADYDPSIAQCYCPDGSMIKAIDCRWVDCPGEISVPTEFTIKNGSAPKVTVEINLPLSAREAKKVAIAACGISEETPSPPSPYENIISECSPAWGFLDESNPCNHTLAQVCGNDTFVRCTFGGQTKGAFCINGMPIIQGEYNETFIVANPLDLSQAREFTKFRSCAGHDYSGYNDKGELETQRSMKQGVIAKSGITKMNVYSPFDGIITKYALTPGHEEPEEEHFIEIIGYHSGKWFITFSHFTAKEGLKTGSNVTAGELIGTSTIQAANAENDGVEVGLNQDVSTETIKEQFVRGAILDYADKKVLDEYASYGLTPENTSFTKEYRDAHPCTWDYTAKDPANFATVSKI